MNSSAIKYKNLLLCDIAELIPEICCLKAVGLRRELVAARDVRQFPIGHTRCDRSAGTAMRALLLGGGACCAGDGTTRLRPTKSSLRSTAALKGEARV